MSGLQQGFHNSCKISLHTNRSQFTVNGQSNAVECIGDSSTLRDIFTIIGVLGKDSDSHWLSVEVLLQVGVVAAVVLVDSHHGMQQPVCPVQVVLIQRQSKGVLGDGGHHHLTEQDDVSICMWNVWNNMDRLNNESSSYSRKSKVSCTLYIQNY